MGDGIYRSVDGGKNFKQLKSGTLQDLYRSPRNPDHIYCAGMTAAYGPQGSYQALALYRSTDGGATWATTKANSTSSYARAIAVDPVREKDIFMSYIDYAAGRYGLVKSSDGGATWKSVRTGALDYFEDLAFDPLDARRIYLCSYEGLYRSDDGGSGWMKVTGGTTDSVLISGTSPQEIFVTQYDKVLRSRDQGKTWEKVDLGENQVHECMSLSYDEARKILYIGTEGDGIIKKQL